MNILAEILVNIPEPSSIKLIIIGTLLFLLFKKS